MTTVMRRTPQMKRVGTKTLSGEDLLNEIHTIRHVLEKVEETNRKVLEQIETRQKKTPVLEDAPQKIEDMGSRARMLTQKMDTRDKSLRDLEISVNVMCGRIDDVINTIDKAKQAEGHINDVVKKRVTESSVRNRELRDANVQSNSKLHDKHLRRTDDPAHVQKKKQNDGKNKQRNTKEQTPDPVDDLPSVVCLSGFKRRLTQEDTDNRHNADKLAEQRQRPRTRESDSDEANVNIKNTYVRIKAQEARFEADFKRIPGLSADSLVGGEGGALLADLVWQQWHSYAEEEKNKDSQRHIVRCKGPDVVLCLDISQSMEGAPFEEMMSFAMKYVEGVEQVSHISDLTENISVTTFGCVTKVWIHLTSNYSAVKATLREIWSLIPRGRSPIGGGLLVALAGCLGNADVISVGEIPILARIILISDGKGTPDHIKTGPDLMRAEEEDMRSSLRVDGNLQQVSKNLKKRRNIVYCVPVGNANTRTLEEISKCTGGKVFSPIKRDRLVDWSKLTVRAASLCKKVLELVPGKSSEETDALLKVFLNDYLPMQSQEDKEDIVSIAGELMIKLDDAEDEHLTSEHDPDLPPLGTRVRRGPGWHYPDHQDNKGPGTVCNHGKTGMVWVEWDNSHRNCYNYKDGIREVVSVTEKRVLRRDEMIAPGCYVKRGDNWSKGDEDGGPGTMGVVTRVHQHGTVIVRWPNKKFSEYKFGSEGLFEVQVCADETHSTPTLEGGSDSYMAPDGEGLRIESFLPPPQ
ncbi:uncharacterized protein LOC132562039 [Ylistrum balloti]|uniref:uncharacterized protein LOC132562039 n=1 Tax=Ylistrum balloti TaxID=509963 RepID=UPI002905E569|nr:uncharacterized protein LOC132562039 [Ylistrum balloti]